MAETIITVENISKLYRLGEVGTGTLSHDLNRWWHKLRGKEDPYSKVGVRNDRAQANELSEYVWALKDISFEVEKGEVLGIIGKNGAGKSTLLKLLSRITSPTTGEISMKGRVASLLEVGTGFHPELTGRENIFLNGAILGMTRKEIKAKFDEIIDFAGCALFIDTPIKRYSSGMIVRLGFAVAAFLEPEILIVDEVLAVGDAEFQKKAVGKIKNVSSEEGRTVLFVSHNMSSIKTLCSRALLMEQGKVVDSGDSDMIVQKYLDRGGEKVPERKLTFSNDDIRMDTIYLSDKNDEKKLDFQYEDDIKLTIAGEAFKNNLDYDLTVQLCDVDLNVIFTTSTAADENAKINSKGRFERTLNMPGKFLNEGLFYINLQVVRSKKYRESHDEYVLAFNILPLRKEMGVWMGRTKGVLKPVFDWT